MELTFPFKNLTLSYLLKLFEVSVIEDYYNSNIDIEVWASKNHEVSLYQSLISSFENEILQTIDTTTQETIDSYFLTVGKQINHIDDLLTKKNLIAKIEEWNDIESQKFNVIVNEKIEIYSKNENRNRKHLEIYETEAYQIPIFMTPFGKRKILKTNYNYYCIEEKLKYIAPSFAEHYFPFLEEQTNFFVDVVMKYGIPWKEGKVKSKATNITLKPILFCEGDIDIRFIEKASELLEKTSIISNIELRYRGSCHKLDTLWLILTENNWETVPQKKILLYDCDTDKSPVDFGHIAKRMIPKIDNHPIQKGIENLFPEITIRKALEFKKEFFDIKITTGTERGLPIDKKEININKHEKRNFCNWLLEHGTKEDFIHFKSIFDIIESLI